MTLVGSRVPRIMKESFVPVNWLLGQLKFKELKLSW